MSARGWPNSRGCGSLASFSCHTIQLSWSTFSFGRAVLHCDYYQYIGLMQHIFPWESEQTFHLCHFRKKCDSSSTVLPNFCFPSYILMPHLNTWDSDLFSDVIWCLAKTMAKLERNSLGTEPWTWYVQALFSKEPLHTWFLHTRHEQFLQQCLSPLLPLCLGFSVHCGLCQYIFSRVTAPSSLLCCDSPRFCWTRSLKLESFHPLPFLRAGLPVPSWFCLSSQSWPAADNHHSRWGRSLFWYLSYQRELLFWASGRDKFSI